MAGILYNFLLILISPFAFVGYLWRIFVSKKSNESWRENLGALPLLKNRPLGQQLVWLHAVSVGEVVASLPIQDEIRRLLPDAFILVTTITQTGNAVALKSAKSADAVAYLPLDYPLLVNRAMNRVKPDILVTVEKEIWPNLLAAAKKRGIPTALVNGCMSDKGFRRGSRWRWLMSWAFSNIDRLCMQTRTDAERMTAFGVPEELISVFGSTKFDQEGGQLDEEAVRALKADLGLPDGAPVFVAGSANPGEDEPALDAYQEMRKSAEGLKLIIAPRQIDRGEEIQAMVEARGLRCIRRSKKETGRDFDVLILDTLGELASTYAVGEVAFVGGTLIPKGGHSLFQPVLQGKPVLFGPYTFKTRDMAEMVLSAGVGFEVKDAHELARLGISFLADPKRRAEVDAACRRMVSENRGASTRSAEVIARLLKGHPNES